jgi:hypothetical protein
MHHAALIALYFVIGLACAAFVLLPAPVRDAKVIGSALATVVLWPLWAPFALAVPAVPARGPLASRIAAALEPSAGQSPLSPPQTVLSRGETALLLRQVEAAERRLIELGAQLTVMHSEDVVLEPDCAEARARVELRASSRCQLETLRDREHRALVDLAELCELLRAQQLLTRFGGSERVSELRDELWFRVQALSELGG